MTNLNYSQSCNCFHVPISVKPFAYSPERLKVLTKLPLIINKSTDIAEAAQIMYRKRISGMPVASSVTDLDGIITKTDIVRALIKASNNGQ